MPEKYQKIVATGFLFKDGKVLSVKRSEKETFLPGYYELPGGKIDFGEEPGEALRREFREEVGLEISVGKPFRTFSYVSSGGDRHTVEIIYIGTLNNSNSEVILSEAHTEFRWIEEGEVENYNFSDETKKSIVEGFRAVHQA